MDTEQEPTLAITDTSSVSDFDVDELKQLAKFLDALMEADLSLDERLVSNAR